jgi:hypothetical protein
MNDVGLKMVDRMTSHPGWALLCPNAMTNILSLLFDNSASFLLQNSSSHEKIVSTGLH